MPSRFWSIWREASPERGTGARAHYLVEQIVKTLPRSPSPLRWFGCGDLPRPSLPRFTRFGWAFSSGSSLAQGTHMSAGPSSEQAVEATPPGASTAALLVFSASALRPARTDAGEEAACSAENGFKGCSDRRPSEPLGGGLSSPARAEK
jgi:hypothetical protein